MSDLKILTLAEAEPAWINLLMDREESAWKDELGWDYAPVREILTSYIIRGMLPGYLALHGREPAGYGYFLMAQQRGIIGTVYAPPSHFQQPAADEIIGAAIRELKALPNLARIESQILPFHNLGLAGVFVRHGFQSYARYFMEASLRGHPHRESPATPFQLIPWNSALLPAAAQVVFEGYVGQADALLSEEYQSERGCEGYLRSLIENPGCGTFLPGASFMALEERGRVCGFILCSRISASGAMIPQVTIAPAQQGRRLGASLIHRALTSLSLMGLFTVGLTVTKKNHRAFEWYSRLGFRIRKEFAAFVWERPPGGHIRVISGSSSADADLRGAAPAEPQPMSPGARQALVPHHVMSAVSSHQPGK